MLTIQEIKEIKRKNTIFGSAIDGATVENLCNTAIALHDQLLELIKAQQQDSADKGCDCPAQNDRKCHHYESGLCEMK